MSRKYGFSFSWKRATGISNVKRKISKATGIPLTRSGRQRKMGKMMGCLVYVMGLVLFSVLLIGLIILI